MFEQWIRCALVTATLLVGNPAQAEAAEAEAKAAAAAMLQSAEEVTAEVEQIMGRKFKAPVQKAVMTKAELRAELGRLLEKEYGKGRLERLEAWLRTLALLSGEADLRTTMTDVLLSQVGGFYDPERKSFFMMAESAAYGEVINRMMIAHELCHALDDQYVDLQQLQRPGGRDPTEDETYVIGAVIEGSATALMFQWMARAMQRGAKVDDMAKMAEQQKDQMEVLLQAPPYCTLLAANYMVGHHFMTRGEGFLGLARGAAEGERVADIGNCIVDVAAAMPRSSEQLLHPEKYWQAAARDEPVLLVNEAALVAEVERRLQARVLERNTLGEMVAALVAGPASRRLNAALMARADYWTNRAAKGWGGDRLLLVGAGGGEAGKAVESPGVVWWTAWDTAADAEEFVAAVQKYRGEAPGFTVVTAGRAAIFAFGSARTLDAAALRGLLEAAECTQDGRPWTR